VTARFCAVIARCCSTAPRSQAPCGNLRSTDGGPHGFAQRAETAHEFGFQPSAPELLTSPYTMQWASRAKNAGSKTALGKKVSTDDTRQTNQSVTCGLPPNPIRQREPLSHSSHQGCAIRSASPAGLDNADELRQSAHRSHRLHVRISTATKENVPVPRAPRGGGSKCH